MNFTPQHSLLQWYHKHGRHHLPWRITSNPYHIYISEIMLQQTQVKTVLERFYFPFLEAFPTLADVASSDLDDVLKRWEGLGYYTRARNLYAACRQCNGILPKSAHELIKLPGIGRSTAHAIAAFAYREPLPILDANVKRILHRYYAITKRDEKVLWNAAYKLFDTEHPFEYNQAMMDLGAMVCLSKKPLCNVCPLESKCQGKNTPLSYPSAKTKKIKPTRERNIIIFVRNEKLALTQRRDRFLHGLWGFYESNQISSGHFLGSITQEYSHFTLKADVYLSHETFNNEEFEWFEIDEIKTLSLSRADHKVMELYKENLSGSKNASSLI